MKLQQQAINVNKLLSEIYKSEIKLSGIISKDESIRIDLQKLTPQQIQAIYNELLMILEKIMLKNRTPANLRKVDIIIKRFGLDGSKTKTLQDIGQFHNISRERVRQLENKILRNLRHPRNKKLLEDSITKAAIDILESDRLR